MNKLFLVVIISLLYIGCNNQEQDYKSSEGWTFEEVKNEGSKFKFDKKTNSNDNKSDLHKGCTAPCCSEKH